MNTPTSRIPGYRLLDKIAEGGMGVVYRAEDETLGRKVAVKMIRAELLEKDDNQEESLARFLREARAAAQIRSNHVAHVLQFGETESGDRYLVLEYLDGITLDRLLRQAGRLSPARAVHIARQLCRGLGAAHALGIVHRDLKPSNVMLLEQDGERDFVKILDFGVAKLLGERESGVTQAGMLVGTYTSMAPEQVQNETIDARTDVYALGVLLYRSLVGAPPFQGADIASVLFHHVYTRPQPLSQAAPDVRVPGRLDHVVMRCLEKKPEARPQTMEELERLLAASLDVTAEPATALRAVHASAEPQLEAWASDPAAPTALSAPSLAPPPPAASDDNRRGEGETLALSAHDLAERTPSTGTDARRGLLEGGVGPASSAVPRAAQAPSVASAPPRSPRGIWLAAGLAVVLLVAIGLVVVATGRDEESVVVTRVERPEPVEPISKAAAVVAPEPMPTAVPANPAPTPMAPEETAPTEAKPTEAKPTEAKPTEAKPTEAKPTEAKPTEAKPTRSEPATSQPAAKRRAPASRPRGERAGEARRKQARETADRDEKREKKPTKREKKPAKRDARDAKPRAKSASEDAPTPGFIRVRTKED